MTEKTTTTLYRKVGRRYLPAYSEQKFYDADLMAVGTFKLVHAYESGARRYEHEVTPDTAAVVAGLMQFRDAMVKAMQARAIGRPSEGTYSYAAKQRAVIEKFRAEMAAVGGLLPLMWTTSSPYDIADAAVQTLRTHLVATPN